MGAGEQDPPPVMGFGISGYRTLDGVEILSPGPVTVVCGPNNVGKSSLLSALPLYSDLVAHLRSGRPQRQRASDINGVGIRAKIALDLNSGTVRSALAKRVPATKYAALVEALEDAFEGPLWLHFANNGEQWAPDLDGSLSHLARLMQTWSSARATRRLAPELAKAFEVQTLDAGWLKAVAKSCMPRPNVTFIADVRRTAEKPLADADLWKLARANVRRTGRSERVEPWADLLERVLRDVFGD